MIMISLLGIAVFILFVCSALFRQFTAGLIVLAGFAGVAYLLHQHEQTLSRSRIPASQIALENVTLTPEFSMYQISGRIKNQSTTYTLKQVTIDVTMQECTGKAPSRECVTIGKTKKEIYLDLPPCQAVAFNDSVYFSDRATPPTGRHQWACTISQSEAE